MSTLQVANLHFESTGNNRIQYLGSTSGYVLVGGGSNVAVINSSSIYFPQNFQIDNLSINTVSANSNINASSYTTTGVVANVTGVYPASNSLGTALGSSSQRWILNANTGNFSGDVTINNTLNTGNATVNGSISVTGDTTLGNVNITGSFLNVASAFIANSTGAYHTGVINAASHTVGTSFVANSTGAYHTGTINAASYTVGSTFTANATLVNAASYTVGTTFTANATLVNAVSYYSGTLLVANNTVINATHIGGSPASSVINTTAAFTRTGVTTFSANLILGSSGVSANGGFGTSGQVLTSNGTATYWSSVSAGGSGTVTQVNSGNGLTGGPITGTGTLSVVAGNTLLISNSTGIWANQAAFNHNTLLNYVADEHVAHSGVSILPGNGLTGGGTITTSRTLTVIAGNTQLISNSTGVWANQANFNHNALTNYVAAQHVDHSTVSIIAGTGLTGGGTIAASRTLSVDPTGINHDALSGFVADEHVAHSGVSITAGAGLTGGGTIAASRTLTVVGGPTTTVNSTGVHVNTAYIDTAAVGSASNLRAGAAGKIPYQSASGVTDFTGIGSVGQILVSFGSSAPYWQTARVAYADSITNSGQIGAYIFAYWRGLGLAAGDLVSGTGIEAAGLDFTDAIADDDVNVVYATKGSSTLSGTWMVMGRSSYSTATSRSRLTLFLRVA